MINAPLPPRINPGLAARMRPWTRWLRLLLVPLLLPAPARPADPPIDRQALVSRHNVRLTRPDPQNALTVGNGEFAFTADITGLQTFPEFHADHLPLGTQSHWAWHTFPNPAGYTLQDALTAYDAHGRPVPYLDGSGTLRNANNPERARAANAWLRANPHRLHLGRLGLVLQRADRQPTRPENLARTEQTLDLWRGLLDSRFQFEHQPVRVRTLCHPDRDLLAVRIESPLLSTERLRVVLEFPYATGNWKDAADWHSPDRHQTRLRTAPNRADFVRILDGQRHHARLEWSGPAALVPAGPHRFELAGGEGRWDLTLAFAPDELPEALPGFDETRQRAGAHWEAFWTSGGALDLAGSADPRAPELERRVVLSQYLTALHSAGSLPPQESGLVANSWHGKFHLEMHWWHAAHFALWGRPHLLARSLEWYSRILPRARDTARQQGYLGARWPKMVGPDGRESPSTVGVFLIWQQPHPIYFAELLYRAHPTRSTLEAHRERVQATAEFMASYAAWDDATQRYVLGPPLIPAQESYGRMRATVQNPTYELAYWYWGLQTAQRWRERLGLPREALWDKVSSQLARPLIREGRYEAIEVEPFTLTRDHPSFLQAYGFLPATPLILPQTIARTFDFVRAHWDWPSTWGWDYPVLAMTAARLGRPEEAVASLLLDTPKNRYLPCGHVYQRPTLPLYLPANGGLLAAVAMMAAGWDGAPAEPAPGFPKDGQWRVRWEGLAPMP